MSNHPGNPRNSPAGETNLTSKHLAGIALLTVGKSYTDVAAALEIDRKTVWGWRRDPTFRAALSTEFAAIQEAMHLRVLALADKALKALERTLESGDSDSARVAAARLVLERLLPTHATAAEAQLAESHQQKPILDELTREEKIALVRRRLQVESLQPRAHSQEPGADERTREAKVAFAREYSSRPQPHRRQLVAATVEPPTSETPGRVAERPPLTYQEECEFVEANKRRLGLR